MEIPPFKIKAIEKIRLIPKEERVKQIEKVGLNPFSLDSKYIFIDLLTDSGTGAMSQEQWAGLMLGDESYAGSINFEHLKNAVKNILGFEHVIPTHQGRGAEHTLDNIMVEEGKVVSGNIHFDTTKAHIEHRKGKAVDCTIDEIYDPAIDHPFKGNIDLEKLEKALKENKGKVAYVLITLTCNSGGGQPVSLQNIAEVYDLVRENKVPLFFDAARFAENAYFIKEREHPEMEIREIIKEMMKHADGCTMSAKKDAIVNIGGFIAVRNKELYEKLADVNVLFEGFPTYGGLAGRDMEAIAIGLYEGIDYNYLSHRVGQVKKLGDGLIKTNIPIVKPVGGHAVYIDAKKFFPHIAQENFPGHTLAVELYIEGGVRAVEIGTLLAGRDSEGNNIYPELELTRLTIPRRVYTKEHLDYVAEVVKKVYERRDKIRGLKLTYEPPVLRHFRARFERI